MALSNKRILEEMEKSNIVIDPFMSENLATSSYDLTLGEWFFREHETKHHNPLYNIYNKSHTDHIWGEPQQARRAEEEFQKLNFSWTGIGADDRVIVLLPGETILAHTNEFIGGRNTITTMMKARSSMGRNFIEVCKCAGWGDVGYINRWTMEITNNSRHYSIPLVVGRRIAQMVFFETGPILERERDYAAGGKYQTETTLDDLKRSWTPHAMLPKMWLDREVEKK